MYVEFDNLRANEKEEYKNFVKETYERNNYKTTPKISGVIIGDIDIIVLENQAELYYGPIWANAENDKSLNKQVIK